MTAPAALQALIAQVVSDTLELKRAGEPLCAFLNGEGGKVLIGVAPDGRFGGQGVVAQIDQAVEATA